MSEGSEYRRAVCGSRSTPFQDHTNIARHSIGKVYDLDFQLVSEWTKLPVPEVVQFLRKTRQRCFPARFLGLACDGR